MENNMEELDTNVKIVTNSFKTKSSKLELQKPLSKISLLKKDNI
jgi:hypothetical protein